MIGKNIFYFFKKIILFICQKHKKNSKSQSNNKEQQPKFQPQLPRSISPTNGLAEPKSLSDASAQTSSQTLNFLQFGVYYNNFHNRQF